jgi:hypothetical protein
MKSQSSDRSMVSLWALRLIRLRMRNGHVHESCYVKNSSQMDEWETPDRKYASGPLSSRQAVSPCSSLQVA